MYKICIISFFLTLSSLLPIYSLDQEALEVWNQAKQCYEEYSNWMPEDISLNMNKLDKNKNIKDSYYISIHSYVDNVGERKHDINSNSKLLEIIANQYFKKRPKTAKEDNIFTATLENFDLILSKIRTVESENDIQKLMYSSTEVSGEIWINMKEKHLIKLISNWTGEGNSKNKSSTSATYGWDIKNQWMPLVVEQTTEKKKLLSKRKDITSIHMIFNNYYKTET